LSAPCLSCNSCYRATTSSSDQRLPQQLSKVASNGNIWYMDWFSSVVDRMLMGLRG